MEILLGIVWVASLALTVYSAFNIGKQYMLRKLLKMLKEESDASVNLDLFKEYPELDDGKTLKPMREFHNGYFRLGHTYCVGSIMDRLDSKK